jgi:hypothetical protein
MVGVQIPNLIVAYAEPGDSEPTKFGDYVIAKNFVAVFRFRDEEKVWVAIFTVRISELGTPKLLKIEVTGSRAKHPKPLMKTYTRENLHELLNNTPGRFASKEELDEFERLAPEPESVERWQLKVIEQYRFQLLELGIRLAIDRGEPTYMKTPDGEKRRVYLNRDPLTEFEVKKLLKEIDKKIRQKLTPEFLGEVARIYTEAGLRSEKPIKAIEEFYKCSYRTAQDYATKARILKLLPETTPGKVTVKKSSKGKEKK